MCSSFWVCFLVNKSEEFSNINDFCLSSVFMELLILYGFNRISLVEFSSARKTQGYWSMAYRIVKQEVHCNSWEERWLIVGNNIQNVDAGL